MITATEIAKIVVSKVNACGIVGIRAERKPRKRLGKIAKSWNWSDGNHTTKLDGTCAIGLAYDYDNDYDDIEELTEKIQKNLNRYGKYINQYGDHIIIVVGDKYEYGNDEWANEVIIKDCKAIGRCLSK